MPTRPPRKPHEPQRHKPQRHQPQQRDNLQRHDAPRQDAQVAPTERVDATGRTAPDGPQDPVQRIADTHSEEDVSLPAYVGVIFAINALLGRKEAAKLQSQKIFGRLPSGVRDEVDPQRGGIGLASIAPPPDIVRIAPAGPTGAAVADATVDVERGPTGAWAHAEATRRGITPEEAGRQVQARKARTAASDFGGLQERNKGCGNERCGDEGDTSIDRGGTTGVSTENTGLDTKNTYSPFSGRTRGPGAIESTDAGGGRRGKRTEAPSNKTGLNDDQDLLDDDQGPFSSFPVSDRGRGVPGRGRESSGTACGNRATSCNRDARDVGALRDINALSETRIEALKKRTPTGDFRRLAVPTSLYERIVDWQPAVGRHAPLAALLQYNLFAWRRDETWSGEGRQVGILLPHELVFASFGFAPSTAYNQGLNSKMLLQLYRREVDPAFQWTGWNGKNGKARVIKAHGIPREILDAAEKMLLGLEERKDWRYLIDGRSASTRRIGAKLNKDRREAIREATPKIPPPSASKFIRRYLNSSSPQHFRHGGYGVFRPTNIESAVAEATSSIQDSRRRWQELRKLVSIYSFPQPLHLHCDFSPRLKPDHFNQAMNLASDVRRSLYTDRDIELDLAKAHLSALVPVAKREGMESSVLHRHLRASAEGEDLWETLAASFSSEHAWNAQAARSAAKKTYALAYGASDGALLHEMSTCYGDATGDHRRHDAFSPVLECDLVKEVRRLRDDLKGLINARGGLTDVEGRFIELSHWDDAKAPGKRWRGVLSYVNASYEQALMKAAFDVAQKERDRSQRARFRIWLYQADGFTLRVASKASPQRQVERLQRAVAEKAEALGVPTTLEVGWWGASGEPRYRTHDTAHDTAHAAAATAQHAAT